MIIKKRSKPRALQKLEASTPRLNPGFKRRQDLEKDLGQRYKGYIGELKVDHHVEVFLAHIHTVLYDVCLNVNGKTLQIDTIVITPQAIYLLEIKNYNGTITFDTIFNQFIRDNGQNETGFRYPITQAETQRQQLMMWLHERNIYNVPVYFFIVISEPSTILKVTGDQEAIAKVVIHGESVTKKIIETDEKLKQSNNKTFNGRKLGTLILNEVREHDIDILGKYQIRRNDILSGVCCPNCGLLGMGRIYNGWKCKRCEETSRFAHKRALSDYLLLMNPWITNSESMRWLHIDSKSMCTRLLKRSGLNYDSARRRWKK